MKGGKLPFAAVCTEVRIADKPTFCEISSNVRFGDAEHIGGVIFLLWPASWTPATEPKYWSRADQ